MKRLLLALSILCGLVATVASQASTLTVVVRNHSTLLVENGERRSAYAMFTDEDLVEEENIMRRLLLTLLTVSGISVFATEPLDLSFVIHGRAPLDMERPESPGYGLVGSAVFAGDPVIMTLTVLNPPPGGVERWTRHLQWKVVNETGETVAVAVHPAPDTSATAPLSHRLQSSATFANFMVDLPPGRYAISVRWTDSAAGAERTTNAEARWLVIYRGDESLPVCRAFLRKQAKTTLAQGTLESYRTARAMLIEAADGNTDPSVYEELADASAPWAAPEETVTFYERSLDIARRNLEKKYGSELKTWPERALHLYVPHARKVDTFRNLVPYYKLNFHNVRVAVVPGDRRDRSDMFVVERRSDGSRLRVIDPQQ